MRMRYQEKQITNNVNTIRKRERDEHIEAKEHWISINRGE